MKLKELVEKYGDQEVLCWAERADESLKWVNIKLEKPKPKTVWDLEDGDPCVYIDAFGEITSGCLWSETPQDERAREIGNVFLTLKDSYRETERRRVENLLIKHGGRRTFKNGDGWWNVVIKIPNNFQQLQVERVYDQIQGAIYFDTYESANKAIDEIGEKRIKKALFEAR